MKILAIDTATEACSAALLLDGTISERFKVLPRKHGELILHMMDDLLNEAGLGPRDLDALAFGRGPGAFTGVRIGTGVAQGAALGAGLPLLPVSNLAALAQRLHREQGAMACLAAFDARMDELYWGAYRIGDQGLAEPVGEEQVSRPENLRIPESGQWHGTGKGWAVHGDALRRRLGDCLSSVTPDLLCHAHDLALLGAAMQEAGQGVPPGQGLPVYLRDQVAVKKQPA